MITRVLGITFLTFAYMFSPSLGIKLVICVMSVCFHICATLPWNLVKFSKFSSMLNIEFPSSVVPKTCTHGFQWSFTLSPTTNVIHRLAKEGKHIKALFFAHSFRIMNHVQHVPLFKTYMKEAHKTTQSLFKTKKQNNLTAMQVIKIHLWSCGYGFLFLSYKLTWNKIIHGIFLILQLITRSINICNIFWCRMMQQWKSWQCSKQCWSVLKTMI
jgi:hypothetical protein